MSKKVQLVLLMLTLGASLCFSQSAPVKPQDDKNPPKKDKFGSSLKKLKWDPKTKTAVEQSDKDSKQTSQKAVEPEEELNLESSLAVFDVMVIDRDKHFVSGLTKNDFIIHEDNVEQQVGTFNYGDDVTIPRSIMLIVDYSGSQTPFISASIEAAKTLVGQLGPEDEMAIATDDIELVQDYTKNKAELTKTLDGIYQKSAQGHEGRSRQFSALLATLQERAAVGQRRFIIIFQTDGDEIFRMRDQEEIRRKYVPKLKATDVEDTKFGFADVEAKAEHTKTTIYTVVPGEQLIDLSPEETDKNGRKMLAQMLTEAKTDPNTEHYSESYVKNFTALKKVGQVAAATVAVKTGGWAAFLSSPSEANGIYGRILSDINHRYMIGYYPTNGTPDGKIRRVKIEIRNHPEYTVHSRDYYYAPSKTGK